MATRSYASMSRSKPFWWLNRPAATTRRRRSVPTASGSGQGAAFGMQRTGGAQRTIVRWYYDRLGLVRGG